MRQLSTDNDVVVPVGKVVHVLVTAEDVIHNWTVPSFGSKLDAVPGRVTATSLSAIPVVILLIIAIPSFKLLFLQYSYPKPDLTIKATGYQWYWGHEYPDQGGFSFDSTNGEGDGIRILQNGAFTILADTTPDGSAEKPFEIATPSDLEAIPDSSSDNYVLTANIDMTAAGLFDPILMYSGTFDGRGYEIQNIDLDHNASPQHTAIFGSLAAGALIKRVGVTSATVRSGSAITYAAPLVAATIGVITIQDCWATGGTVTTDGNQAGGLIGNIAASGTVTRCWSANVISGVVGAQVGGCIGNSAGTTDTGNFHDSDVATYLGCNHRSNHNSRLLGHWWNGDHGWQSSRWPNREHSCQRYRDSVLVSQCYFRRGGSPGRWVHWEFCGNY